MNLSILGRAPKRKFPHPYINLNPKNLQNLTETVGMMECPLFTKRRKNEPVRKDMARIKIGC